MTKTKKWIVCALFAAIVSVVAPFVIPIGPVPITFSLFALALIAFVGGSRMGAVATIIYFLIGIIGMPVFAGFKSGIAALMDPTGGFIFAYVFIVLILGLCTRVRKKSAVALIWITALLVCYTAGVVWYVLYMSASPLTALWVCVLPFIPFDVIKLVMAYVIAKKVRRTLVKLGLL